MNRIPVTLTNRRAVFDCSPEQQLLLKEIFSYKKKSAEFTPSFKDGSWDGRTSLFRNSSVSAGLFLTQLESLRAAGLLLRISDQRVFAQYQELPSEKARPYQVQAVDAVIAHSNTGGLLLSATGTGKTFLAGEVYRRLRGNGLFIVDELTLLAQSQAGLVQVIGEEIGIVGKSIFDPRRITVATIQTLNKFRTQVRFKKWFKTIDVMFIDEIHVALNRSNISVVTSVKPKAVFGLTATLELKKEYVRIPAFALAGPVIFEYPLAQGVEEGFLERGVAIQVRFQDPSKTSPGYNTRDPKTGKSVRIEEGSAQADYRYRVVRNRSRNDCIEHLVRQGIQQGRKIVVIVERIAHLQILSKRLIDIPHHVLCGRIKDRPTLVHELETGKVSLVLANRVFGKGIDVPSLNTVIDGTAMSSTENALQRYGRGTRRTEGKTGFVHIDIADSRNRFSYAAHQRAKAFQAACIETRSVVWDPKTPEICSAEVFSVATRVLARFND